MAHTPFGYAIVNGKIEVHAKEAEQLKLLIASYLSGQSLANAAKFTSSVFAPKEICLPKGNQR